MAGIARRQHGVISGRQLDQCGLSPSAVRSRVETGRLHRVHRGIFAVGHPLLTTEGRWMAAVLACGPGAVLSHRSAAAHWGLRPCQRAIVDVSTPGRRGRGIPGIDAHRGSNLTQHDVTRMEGIPCTTPARTLLDLAATVDPPSLLRAIDRAEQLRRFDGNQLRRLLERADGHPGSGALRTALAECNEPAFTRSDLERRFLVLCELADIPPPQTNAIVEAGGESFEVDFHWPDRRLIVETDSRRFHLTARAFEADRRRDQLLTLAGWRVVRFTWRQVTEDPQAVAVALRALLRQ